MSDTIRVGLVGYGYASKTFHVLLITAVPGMKLVAVSSSDVQKVHADWADVIVVDDPQALFSRTDIDLVAPFPPRMKPISLWPNRRC